MHLSSHCKPLGSIIVEVQPKIFADLWFASCSCKSTEVGSSLPQNQPDTRYPAAYSARGKASQPPIASHSAQAALGPFPALQMTKILVSHRLPFMLPHPFDGCGLGFGVGRASREAAVFSLPAAPTGKPLGLCGWVR